LPHQFSLVLSIPDTPISFLWFCQFLIAPSVFSGKGQNQRKTMGQSGMDKNRENRWGKQEWTKPEKTDGASRNGQNQRKLMGQSGMDKTRENRWGNQEWTKPETLATLGKQDTG
jgi:hypothetical protein